MDNKLVVSKLLEHDDRLERIEAKLDQVVTKNEFLDYMDKILRAINRIDEERLFTIHRLDRHEEGIVKIKTKIGLTD